MQYNIFIQAWAIDCFQKECFDFIADKLLQKTEHKITRSSWQRMSETEKQFDFAFLWNGRYSWCDALLRYYPKTQFLFCEQGWLDRDTDIQLDHKGTHGNCSWAETSLESIEETTNKYPVRTGDLLLVLPGETYMLGDVEHWLSPWFPNAYEFTKFVIENSCLLVRVRPRPGENISQRLFDLVEQSNNAHWCTSDTFEEAMETCCAVATINSTCGAQAIEKGIPVLCYGKTIYRRKEIAFCCNDYGPITQAYTRELKAGNCFHLSRSTQRQFIKYVREKQWKKEDFPNRLVSYLEEIYNVQR